MTARTDVTVDWEVSPRIFTVAAPSVELTIQDLHDTCIAFEDSLEGGQHPRLILTAGDESLGGGVFVGLTATLQDVQIAFEARTTPLETGSVTTGGTTTLIDSAATFQTNNVARGDIVINLTDSSQATVITVDSEIQLTTTALTGGTSNDFAVSDNYDIYDIVQCSISGGNVVAVDSAEAELDPVFPTFGTQVVRTASSSATNTNSADLEHGSYNNSVTIDTVNGVSGTTHPTGTSRQPVDNLTDAKSIATTRGFNTLRIVGDFTLGATDNVDGYILISESDHLNTLTVTSGCSTNNTNFRDFTIVGTLDGEVDIHDCRIGSAGLSGMNGAIEKSMIIGDITYLSGGTADVIDCYSGVAGTGSPEFYLSGVTSTNIRGYVGGVGLNNVDGGNVSVDLDPGTVHLRNTCTAGTIKIRGAAEVNDDSNGSTVDNQTVHPVTIWANPNALTLPKWIGLR